MSDHTAYLRKYKKKKLEEKRPIPYEDGDLDREGFIKVHENGTKVTFKLQEGTYKEKGYNGVYPIALVKFIYSIYDNIESPDRETNEIKLHLEEALLWDVKRSVRREETGVWGYGNKTPESIISPKKTENEIKEREPEKNLQ